MNEQQTPITEAVSVISIVALMVAICCFAGATNNVPVVAPTLFWVAVQMYRWMPALGFMTAPQIPLVVSAATVGIAFWLLALPFAGLLAKVFSVGQLVGMDRQQARLKRNRARLEQIRRDRDKFNVS